MNAVELARLVSCDRCGAAVADEYRHHEFHQLLDAVEVHLDGLE